MRFILATLLLPARRRFRGVGYHRECPVTCAERTH